MTVCEFDNRAGMPTLRWRCGSNIDRFVILMAGWACQLCDGEVCQECSIFDGTLLPSRIRRCLEAPVRKGVGSNRTGVIAQQIGILNLTLAHHHANSPLTSDGPGYHQGRLLAVLLHAGILSFLTPRSGQVLRGSEPRTNVASSATTRYIDGKEQIQH